MRPATQQLVDELLVMRCQDGDAEALERLVDRWQRPLWRHAFRLTGHEEAAWEAVQEGWLGIIRGLRRLDDPARFRQWAYRIVTNKAADWIHRHQRLRKRRQDLSEPPPTPATTEAVDNAQDLRTVLNRLPVGQKVILGLRYLEDFSIAKIAEILAIPAGTVKSRLHSARQELRKLWEKQRP